MDRWFKMAPQDLRKLLRKLLMDEPEMRPDIRELSLEIRPNVSRSQKRRNKHFVNHHELNQCDDDKPYNSVISNLHGVSIHLNLYYR